jgi:hypothetical protein
VLPWAVRLTKTWIPIARWRFEPDLTPPPAPLGPGAPEPA